MAYQICSKCIMDTTDRLISFNSDGICSHCQDYAKLETQWNLQSALENKLLDAQMETIKSAGKSKEYDCIIGLSGGVDSSYVAYLAHKYKLRPLCVHLDNGWNSELAVANIHHIVKQFNFELYTHVINWEEFKDLQRSFFKADVVDIEVLSDHAIFGVIMQLAKKFGVKYILSGANHSTEAIMPKSWVHRKQDLANIRDIQKHFGTRPIKTFPQVSTLSHVISMYLLGFKVLKPLNLIDYKKDEVKKFLMEHMGWRDYGGKHYESIFTKFYQAHILPTKFNIDKRRAHLSSLVCSHQMTREEALKQIQAPLYEPRDLENDLEFVCKKLDFSIDEMKDYLKRPEVPHNHFKSDQGIYNILSSVKNFLKIG